MAFRFESDTLAILYQNGWTSDRQISIAEYARHFEETGQTPSPPVFDLLQSFGGLHLKGIIVDPFEVYGKLGESVIRHYERFIGTPLCLVGWLGRGQSALFITPSGEIYSAWSNFVHFWGATLEEAFDNILIHRKHSVVPLPLHMQLPKPQPPAIPPEGTDFGIRHNKDWVPIFQRVTVQGIELMLCQAPTGVFHMGRETGRYTQPIHAQYMTSSYWLTRELITNDQWRQAIEHSAGIIKAPQRIIRYDLAAAGHDPVLVNWQEAQGFARWLGERWRLPTEAEWEFAARGPDNLLDPLNGQEEGTTWIGVQQMGGRLWEWTSSLFRDYPYNATDGREALTSTADRTVRNIGWQARLSVTANAANRLPSSALSQSRALRLCLTEYPVIHS